MIINGKEAKFFWGMIAFEVYQQEILKSKRPLKATSVKGITAIMWAGLLNHYERIGEECEFEQSEIYDFIESEARKGVENKDISMLIKEFNNSIEVQKAFDAIKEDEELEKKNSTVGISGEQPIKQD